MTDIMTQGWERGDRATIITVELSKAEILMIGNALNAEAKSFDESAARLGVPVHHPLHLGAAERRALTKRLVEGML